MKVLIHKMKNANICIYSYENGIIKGSFFKYKPEIGDIIMSHRHRDSNFLFKLEVVEIIKNRDSVIHSDCNYDPTLAYFEIKVADVTFDERFCDVDNSIQCLY